MLADPKKHDSSTSFTRFTPRILRQFCQHMDMNSLLACKDTCQMLRFYALQELRLSFYQHLSKIADDVPALLNILKTHHAFISGSRAVALFDRPQNQSGTDLWIPGDTDFYIPKGQMESILDALTNLLDGTEFAEPVYQDAIPGIHRVVRIYCGEGPPYHRTCDVIESANSSALFPLAWFHSTPVTTVIHPHGFMSAYPDHLLQRRGVTQSYPMHFSQNSALIKYAARGFRLYTHSKYWHSDNDWPACRADCPNILRTFGDHFCLSVMIDVDVQTQSIIPRNIRWKHGGVMCGGTCMVGGKLMVELA